MSACAMQSYNNVTADAWQCGIQTAKKYGVDITTNKGSATVSGFTIAWNYNPEAKTLMMQCTDSPWFVPCSTINSEINSAVEACLAQHRVVVTRMVGT